MAQAAKELHGDTWQANTNGTHARNGLQGVGHPRIQWWKRWFEWEHNLIVAGRTIEKGWVVPQGLGIALIILMLGGVSGLYWRMSEKVIEQNSKLQDQRELLIRMDQRLMDKQSTDEKIEREHRNKDDLQDLQIKDVNDKLLVLNASARKGR